MQLNHDPQLDWLPKKSQPSVPALSRDLHRSLLVRLGRVKMDFKHQTYIVSKVSIRTTPSQFQLEPLISPFSPVKMLKLSTFWANLICVRPMGPCRRMRCLTDLLNRSFLVLFTPKSECLKILSLLHTTHLISVVLIEPSEDPPKWWTPSSCKLKFCSNSSYFWCSRELRSCVVKTKTRLWCSRGPLSLACKQLVWWPLPQSLPSRTWLNRTHLLPLTLTKLNWLAKSQPKGLCPSSRWIDYLHLCLLTVAPPEWSSRMLSTPGWFPPSTHAQIERSWYQSKIL